MKDRSHYSIEDWNKYCCDTLTQNMKDEMEEHLLSCERCMDIYLSLIDGNIKAESPELPSKDFTLNVMNEIKCEKSLLEKQSKKQLKQIMFYYAAAASITIVLTASGLFNHINSSVPQMSAAAVNSRAFSKTILESGWSERLMGRTVSMMDSLIPGTKNK